MSRKHLACRPRPLRNLIEPVEPRRLLSGANWPMKGGDLWNTNRAPFAIPADRLNASLFDVLSWQTPAPGSPNEGNFGGTSMSFFNGAGPAGADLVTGTYHWPKGVHGMDRHTGHVFFSGNPDGGESIGEQTAAFSNDGSVVYVTNDATPNPLMAFPSTGSPADRRGNNGDVFTRSVKVTPDGMLIINKYDNAPSGWTDNGTGIVPNWTGTVPISQIYTTPAIYSTGTQTRVIAAGRVGVVAAYDALDGSTIWTVNTSAGTDADVTVDPASGHVFVVGVSGGDLYITGLTAAGAPLWGTSTHLFYNDPWNSQRAISSGALSHDGATYYFQSSSEAGTGKLFAINTADGSLKWTVDTHSGSNETVNSSPIVTPNGVVIVGNNDGGTYYAIKDDGAAGTVLDTLTVSAGGNARASATLSSDGLLYLPLRTVQTAGNADNPSPTFTAGNFFSAFNLTTGASQPVPPPAGVKAYALDHAVELHWRPVVGFDTTFGHYAVYRSTTPISDVTGLTPVATVAGMNSDTYTDTTAANGTTYYYAITSVTTTGGETKAVASVGPRTPYHETDLQVVSIARPEFPRFAPTYSHELVMEPSGFGPYYFNVATGLGSGQTGATQRFPHPGDAVTYTATVRNRGTTAFSGFVPAAWHLDGSLVASQGVPLSLAPNATATFTYVLPWDNQDHELQFSINVADARPDNNALTSDPLAVPFLTYVDRTFVERFREVFTAAHPGAVTDDIIDWLNMHMDRFNELFAAGGTDKRVHYGVLQVVDDDAVTPPLDESNPYAVFPYRYTASDGDPRLSGYYHNDDDIDYGLLHEMGHQLGLIDLYQLNVSPDQNQVSGQTYFTAPDLMNGVSPFVGPGTASAMQHWLHTAHGYFGQYLYGMPQTMRIRFLGADGKPLSGASVQMFQLAERPGVGKVISNQVKAAGLTDSNGYFTLPNVPINPSTVPPDYAGDQLHDNPFGYLDVVGTNGVLHFKVQYDGATDYAFFDVTEANVAYYQGQTAAADFDRHTALGGPVQFRPPTDMAENNAADWSAWAQDATASVSVDTTRKTTGNSSIRFDTTGGGDTYARYPGSMTARWNLTAATELAFDVYAVNNTIGFQSGSPWVILRDGDGNSATYRYYDGDSPSDILNAARNQWVTFHIPLNAPPPGAPGAGWRRTDLGAVALNNIASMEIHSDTWDYGFSLWLDNVHFDLPTPTGSLTLQGGGGADAYAIRNDGANWLIYENTTPDGAPTYRIPLAQLTSLHIAAGAGDDILTLLSPVPFANLFDAGEGNDTLTLASATTITLSTSLAAAGIESLALAAGASASNIVPQSLRSLTLGAGARLTLSGGPANLTTQSLTLSPTATLDLGRATLTRPYAAAGLPTPIAQIYASIASASHAGRWDAPGITSSLAASDPQHLLAVASRDDGTQVTARLTYYGDANLDLKVSADDIATMLLAQAQAKTGWSAGDFNYDSRPGSPDDWSLFSQSAAFSKGQPFTPPAATAFAQTPITDNFFGGSVYFTQAAPERQKGGIRHSLMAELPECYDLRD